MQWPTDDELLRMADEAKINGENQQILADRLGVERNALKSQLCNARLRKKNGVQKDSVHIPISSSETSEKINVTSIGNMLEIESKSPRIKTLDELITACEIDLDKWIIDRWSANKWEVAMKLKKSDDTYEVHVEPLFQVKANLLPKNPDKVFLAVQPVKMRTCLQKPPAYTKPAGRALIIPDMQIGYRRDIKSGILDPFQDRKAIDIILQIAQSEHFDRICFIGDLIDMSEWSDKFLREPEFYWTTQPAIFETHWWLSQFRQAQPEADIDALEGNHDARPQTMMVTHLLAAYGLTTATNVTMPVLSVDYLLSLNDLGIEYKAGYPDNESWAGPVRLIHGNIARGGRGDTVKALSADAQESVIQGHIHRIEWASKVIESRHNSRVIVAFSPGCLCRVDYVVPGHKRGQNWQQGAAVVEWDGWDYEIKPILIQQGRAVHNGKVFIGRDRLPDLNQDTDKVREGWKF